MKKILLASLMCFSSLSLFGCNNNSNSSSNQTNSSSSKKTTSESSNQTYTPYDDEKVHLVILAGQSGARGKALVKDLDNKQKQTNKDVDIIADGLIMEALDNIPESISDATDFQELKPGFGDFPSEFGPELGIGQTLASRYPKNGEKRRSVIVKYTACGSTFTDHWYSSSLYNDSNLSQYLNLSQERVTKNGDATGPLTDNLYQLIDYTIACLEDEGYEVVIDGAAFVHGEQDAKFDDNMEIYEKALTYFINDLRDYVNDTDMPFVVTEALTNSAKHSNALKDIQRKVSNNVKNTYLVENNSLYTNTFEPWHFGAKSNLELGNRIAAEIISHNDTRVIESIDNEEINVPYGVNVKLPKYLPATFDNGYSGYFKVENYLDYDVNTLGEQDVIFTSKTGEGIVENSLIVNVCENISYIDGDLIEYKNVKKNLLPNNLGEVYVVKGEKGLYIGANIKDSEIWTDGEKWSEGDLGQKDQNDDFRVYVTSSTASERMTLCLSADNLFRVYDKGVAMYSDDTTLISNNLVFKNTLKDYDYRANTLGYTNDPSIDSIGCTLELYISYNDLGVTNGDSLKLCFNYNNVSMNNNVKTNVNNYLVKEENVTINQFDEDADSSYFDINDLI